MTACERPRMPAESALPQHQRGARRGGGEELVHDPQVALPDDRHAVEDRDEQHALGEDAGAMKSM